MKQVTIRELRANIKSLLTSLPFQVIDGKSKKVLAEVGVPGDSTSHAEENISKIQKEPDNKSKFLELKKAFENNQPVEKAPEPPEMGMCKVPGCPRKGTWHTDMKFWNSVNGDFDEIPGYYCDKHYQVNRRLV